MKKLFEKIKNSGTTGKIILSLVLAGLTAFLIFYIFLPPINVFAPGFWIYAAAVLLVGALPFMNLNVSGYYTKKGNGAPRQFKTSVNLEFRAFIPVAIPIAVLVFGLIISSTFFNARRYASVITVTESDFADDLPETSEVTNIALMDTDSAMMLGNRTLGSLSNVVSQFTVSPAYMQINYKGSPQKVTNLEYDGFFKWIGNRKSGIPGFVMVDPVGSSAQYVELNERMRYVDSAYFGEDLTRKLRFSFPTKIFDSISFEIDDEGNPYYIVSCARPQVGLFGAMDIEEVIIFDPITGKGELIPVADAPSWIDIVYTGELATKKFNWNGTLSGGFLNSIIGNVGCKQATDDFGYIVIEDDVWYFTGVTSAVSDDKSNIGFVLSNARTGEYKFYSVIGAEEHSAMSAAEGEVQEKGYVASFPSLVNIADQATYIMVLKDDAGLVKLYALVNVENYSIVATGATQAEAMSSYKKLLRQNNIEVGGAGEKTASVTVEDVRIATVSGIATVYVTASDGKVYKGYLEADEGLILIRKGDSLAVKYSGTEIEGIYLISEWEYVSAE